LILSAISVGILAFLIKKKKSIRFRNFTIEPKKVFQIAVVLIILCDLWFFGVGLTDTKDLGEIYTKSDYVEFLIKNTKECRIYDKDKILLDNFQIIYEIQEINGYNPIILDSYDDFLKCIHNLSDNQNHPILDLLNVKYILTLTKLNNSGFKLIFDNNHTYIYENMNVLPRAFVIYNVSVKSKNDIINELKNESFNPTNALLINKNIDNLPQSNKTYEPVEISKYSPNEIILQTNTTEPGFLVLSEVYYPDWKAYVDGEQKEVYRAYNALRAIKLDEGLHTIKFACYSSSLNTGTKITIITIAFLILIILIKFLLVLIKIRCPWRKEDDCKKL
jgi:hypothetical protein